MWGKVYTFAAKKIVFMKQQKSLTLRTLTKSNIWDIQENDVFRLLDTAERESDLKENMRHYVDIVKSAFDIEEVKIDKPEVIAKFEERGFKVGFVRLDDSAKIKWAIKKKPILRVTDLTYENIRHISATKLLEVLDRNFGSGWEGVPQSIQDIIERGFDISTTTLPKDRLHKPGGMYEKKIKDGYEVLEVEKGTWVEAIFAKEKPEVQTIKEVSDDDDDDNFEDEDNLNPDAEEEITLDDEFEENDEEEEGDDSYDDDKLIEESYRTTYDEDPDNLDVEASSMSEEEDF
ncbi:hypothetical protein HMPREF9431_00647 [Segatella oulorum F0390]|uniref:Uncharacterized protein n=2 Tax=Segatella oulorum TaxID=28136 RepID=G1W9Z6_9BACT|nr:hypothetical protein HMPREF9431_00647 [Segatella oulorum F0390]